MTGVDRVASLDGGGRRDSEFREFKEFSEFSECAADNYLQGAEIENLGSLRSLGSLVSALPTIICKAQR